MIKHLSQRGCATQWKDSHCYGLWMIRARDPRLFITRNVTPHLSLEQVTVFSSTRPKSWLLAPVPPSVFFLQTQTRTISTSIILKTVTCVEGSSRHSAVREACQFRGCNSVTKLILNKIVNVLVLDWTFSCILTKHKATVAPPQHHVFCSLARPRLKNTRSS